MNKMYYREEIGWDSIPKKAKEKKDILLSQSPEKQIIELKKLLNQSNGERERLRIDLDQVVKDHRALAKRLRESERYQSLYEEAMAKLEKLGEKAAKTEKRLSEVQTMIDGAMERAMIAETDVAEIKHKNVLKDGMFRSLRGFFNMQNKEFFFQKHGTRSFNQRETTDMLEIIDRGLNTDKIKCQKSFKHI